LYLPSIHWDSILAFTPHSLDTSTWRSPSRFRSASTCTNHIRTYTQSIISHMGQLQHSLEPLGGAVVRYLLREHGALDLGVVLAHGRAGNCQRLERRVEEQVGATARSLLASSARREPRTHRLDMRELPARHSQNWDSTEKKSPLRSRAIGRKGDQWRGAPCTEIFATGSQPRDVLSSLTYGSNTSRRHL
jgi:hypothetical protein